MKETNLIWKFAFKKDEQVESQSLQNSNYNAIPFANNDLISQTNSDNNTNCKLLSKNTFLFWFFLKYFIQNNHIDASLSLKPPDQYNIGDLEAFSRP